MQTDGKTKYKKYSCSHQYHNTQSTNYRRIFRFRFEWSIYPTDRSFSMSFMNLAGEQVRITVASGIFFSSFYSGERTLIRWFQPRQRLLRLWHRYVEFIYSYLALTIFVGVDNGFRIYNVDPFRESFRKVFTDGGIGIVEMLYRCHQFYYLLCWY